MLCLKSKLNPMLCLKKKKKILILWNWNENWNRTRNEQLVKGVNKCEWKKKKYC